jgi:uncharacterized protein (TIGR03435 family)
MNTLAVIIAAIGAAVPSLGQTPESLPSFEVASVKLVGCDATPQTATFSVNRSGERISGTTAPVSLLSYAYGLPAWRMQGIKNMSCFYSVEATMDASATEGQSRLMMQRLLMERLKLVAHRETKELQGFALMPVKSGPKLKERVSGSNSPPMPEYLKSKEQFKDAFEGQVLVSAEGKFSALTGRGVTIPQLANKLSETLGAFVQDRTGLTGKYYFGFLFARDALATDTPEATLFSGLQDEMGLKLESRKGPVEVVVIDSMGKFPSEN